MKKTYGLIFKLLIIKIKKNYLSAIPLKNKNYPFFIFNFLKQQNKT